MKVGIIGFGTEGRANFDHWKAKGAQLTIFDGNPDLKVPAGAKAVLGPHYLAELDGYDLLVRSPGVKPRDIHAQAPITTGIREFFEYCPAPIIGVTGTKGKGTTSTLISEILKAAGKTVLLGGNIGRPPLEFLDRVRPDHWVVLELSSFQLVDLGRSPHIGVCLMIVPEHLNWHADMDEYVEAKSTIARYQSADDVVVYHGRNHYARQIAELSAGHRLPYLETPGAIVRGNEIVMAGQVICRINEVGLIGPHNLENICAAITATWELVDRQPKLVGEVVRQFKGLEHRLEFVAQIDGVRYINDSFSTNPLATEAAVRSFKEPKVVILGGVDRGLDLTDMAAAVAKAQPRGVVTIGETGPAIADLLEARGVHRIVAGGTTIEQIVQAARQLAASGDVVLFSPGCASFDLFPNYKERGKQFRAAVHQLENKS